MKKQVLICTVSPLYPLDSGGKIYSANSILPLAGEFDFHLIAFIPPNARKEALEHFSEHKRYFKTVQFVDRPKIPHEMEKVDKIIHYTKHILKKLPLMDVSFYDREVISIAKKLIKKYKIDILELHNLHTCFLKREFPDIPAILAYQNIEGDIFPFWIPKSRSKWKQLIWDYIAKKSRENTYAIEINNRLNFNVKTFISLSDMERVNLKLCKGYHLPMAFEQKAVVRKKIDQKIRVMWIGGFSWYPNAEGINWFVDNIYSLLILHNITNMEFHFIGGNPPEKLLNIKDNKLFFVHGWVDNVAPFLEMCDLMIVPLLSGSGIRVKIIEAMSSGIPVLSTSKGCEGLNVVDGVHLFIRDDPAEFVRAILDLNSDPSIIDAISLNAIEYIKKHHNIKSCLDIKREIYNSL